MKAEIYRDAGREWRWRIRARNGRIVADSGEGYSRQVKCRDALARLFAVLKAGPLVVKAVEE